MKLVGWLLVVIFFLICFNVYRTLTTPDENYPNKRPKVIYECNRALYDPKTPPDVRALCQKDPTLSHVAK